MTEAGKRLLEKVAAANHVLHGEWHNGHRREIAARRCSQEVLGLGA